MVLAFYKIAALVLKVFMKPVIDQTKKVHLRTGAKHSHPLMMNFFIRLGNNFNYYEQVVNRKFLKIESEFAYKPLNKDLAIEKGINFFYEILFYLVIISIPVYEMRRGSKESKIKSKKLDEDLKDMEKRLRTLITEIKKEQEVLEKSRHITHSLPKAGGKKTSGSKYNLNLLFPNQQVHTYHLDYLS